MGGGVVSGLHEIAWQVVNNSPAELRATLCANVLVAGGNATLDGSITSAMTQAPKGLTGTASLFDAASLMLEHRIAHLLVVDGPRLVGVVSERDLFTHQHVDMVSLARTLSACGSVSAIAEVRQQIQRVVSAMLAQGASGRQLTRLITQLMDPKSAARLTASKVRLSHLWLCRCRVRPRRPIPRLPWQCLHG